MYYKTVRFLLMLILSISLQMQCLSANAFQIEITPRTDLTAGTISDNTMLATVHFWEISENCELNVWDTYTDIQSTPGELTLSEKNSRMKMLNVKLSGEKWHPNTITGKGVFLQSKDKNASLNLIARGEQFMSTNTLIINLTAACENRKDNTGVKYPLTAQIDQH